MADLDLEWHGDLQISAAGDLKLVGISGANLSELTKQRIIRRLLTPLRGYIWHLEYGAGLPQKIGRTERLLTIESLVRAHIALETAVSQSPPPIVTVTGNDTVPGLFLILIVYSDAQLGSQITLSFDTTGQTVSPDLLLG